MSFNPAYLIAPALLAVSGLYSCGNKGADFSYEDFESVDTLTLHARHLTIADLGEGRVQADIADPWNEGKYLGRYLLVHRDSTLPDQIPADVKIIRTPVERAAVFSSIHTNALAELGALECVVAVADADYFPANDPIAAKLAAGTVADLGKAASPSIERIISADTELVLRSPMAGITSAPLPATIVPVEMADYLETGPIARAEWMLLLGELTGCRSRARAIFDKVVEEYSDLALKVALCGEQRPKVLTEYEQSGTWYVPAGGSYAARLLKDAGADYPWADTEGSGSLALSLEAVAEKAIDADLWLIRAYGYVPTAAWLATQNKRYEAFAPMRNNAVYGCDSEAHPIYNDVAFHPERVLREYVAIFHPSLLPGYELLYFTRP